MRNIDFIYMINLDQRPEKFQYCLNQLEPYGITPYRFSAVNGWELPQHVINELGVQFKPWMKPLLGTSFFREGGGIDEYMLPGRSYFCHKMTRGAIGIVMSHLSILQDAYDAGFEIIWVMEDDIQVIQNPHILSSLIDQLDAAVGPDGWDVLFTDQDTKGQDGKYVICRSHAPRPNFTPTHPERFVQTPSDINQEFRQVFARYGAYSMIVRRSGMRKILDFLKEYKVFLPYDMDYYLPEGINLYSVRRDVVSTKPDALSDNGQPNYRRP